VQVLSDLGIWEASKSITEGNRWRSSKAPVRHGADSGVALAGEVVAVACSRAEQSDSHLPAALKPAAYLETLLPPDSQ